MIPSEYKVIEAKFIFSFYRKVMFRPWDLPVYIFFIIPSNWKVKTSYRVFANDVEYIFDKSLTL